MNEVQADRFPEVKSSEKIGGVAPPETRIEAETGLMRLGLESESRASTVYVWLEPGVRPGSVYVVEVVEPIEVGFPSR